MNRTDSKRARAAATPTKHNASTYVSGCRCDQCRADWRTKHRAQDEARAALLAADPSVAQHGRNSTYNNWRCRCVDCSAAHAQVQAQQRRAKAATR